MCPSYMLWLHGAAQSNLPGLKPSDRIDEKEMPHILIDATVSDRHTIDNVSEMQPAVEAMIYRLGLQIRKVCRYQHEYGCSLMYVLENVHCVVHSFPAEDLLCVDVFADGVWPQDVARCIEDLFPCTNVRIKAVVER